MLRAPSLFTQEQPFGSVTAHQCTPPPGNNPPPPPPLPPPVLGGLSVAWCAKDAGGVKLADEAWVDECLDWRKMIALPTGPTSPMTET